MSMRMIQLHEFQLTGPVLYMVCGICTGNCLLGDSALLFTVFEQVVWHILVELLTVFIVLWYQNI